MNGYIKMKLLSDTCVGTGFSVSGIVDTEISFDEYGIPFIPSKRILGIMRDQAQELCAMSGQGDEKIDKLFGKAGQDKSGLVVLRNGTMEDIQHFTNRLISERQYNSSLAKVLLPGNVMNCFTTIRTQTAMEDGVAKEDTLRVSRVINKGHVFYFPMTVDDDSIENENFIKDIIACVRHIGTNRNRGLGHVQCEWVDSPQLETRKRVLPTGANRFPFSIQLQSDCILEKGYIPASTMLGICVNKYMRKHHLTKEMAHTDKCFRNLFMTGQMEISDAYPSSTGSKTVPTPRCFKLKKDEDGKIYNLFANPGDGQYKTPDFLYCGLSDKTITVEKLKTSINFHHMRNADSSIGSANGDSGQFYEYESISAGATFIGEIKSSAENIKILWELLDNETASIGKSRKTQYGNCKITLLPAEEDNDLHDFDDSLDQVPIMLLSDLIVLNKYGQASLLLEDVRAAMMHQLEEPTLKFCQEKCYLSVAIHGGFNTKHRLPTPAFSCIGKGSVLTIDIKEVKDKMAFIQKLYCTPIGEYIKSGCGRMMLLPKYGNKSFSIENTEKAERRATEKNSPLFDTMLPKLKDKYYRMIGKEKLFDKYLQNEYFKGLYEFLCNTKNKSQLRFLYDLCCKNLTVGGIIDAFSHPIEKEQNGRRKDMPYENLYQKLKFPELDGKNNNKVPNTSLIQDIWASKALSNAKNALYSIFEKIPMHELDAYFCYAISILCKRALLERRKKDEQNN